MSLLELPDMQFVDTDVTSTLNNVLQIHAAITGRTLAPGDPERLFLQSLCAIIVQQRVLIDKTAKANLLRYAWGPILDHLGAFSETTRLPASAARTTVRFTLSAPQLSVVAIPAGTRISTGGDPKRYFITMEHAEILSGQTLIDVTAECTEAGTMGNGYLPGQINQIVDPIAFVQTGSNTTESAGGSDVESDDAYRQRIYTAPESFSVAGPDGAYRYWAKTASPAIIDVSVSSPTAGDVLIVPLLKGGEIPSQEIMDAVEDICSSKRVRPLTDRVTVAAPTTVSYNIAFTYWISSERSTDVAAIQTAVNQAVNDYALWQKSKLGRDVNPSELIRRVTMAGAYRVDVVTPVFDEVALTEVAIAGTINATYGGLTDD
ncbi:baseplate J/gp47 family protein [Paenibacillus sp. GYB004]|uniref:baseplate assembly protein n=1 Tax=Paenibacillus sp. GYB004 TaxID=2994393 RepID=UPI002F969AF0